MGLQLRFGIFGAALGVLIGIIGGISRGIPFDVFLLRVFLCALIVGLIGIGLHLIIKTFLPEILSDTPPEDLASDTGLSESPGQTINIVMPEEGFPIDDSLPEADQAEALRQMAAAEDDYSQEEGDEGLVEEVSEDRREKKLSGETGGKGSFSEDAFFQGVEKLPDIGGFSEEFQEQDADGTLVGEGGTVVKASQSSRNSGSGGNIMDPELMAKAIRTALKKDDL